MWIRTKTEQQETTQETLDLYRKRRQESMAIVQRFVKNINKEVLMQSAKQLGLYYKKSIAIETEQALDVLFNHTIFHYLHNGMKMIDRFAREALIAQKMSEEKLAMLDVLQQASYGILSVRETLSFGGTYVEDVLNNKTFLLMDEGLSFSASKRLIIATTYITFPEFSMTTGAALPMNNCLDTVDMLIEDFDLKSKLFSVLPLKQQLKFVASLTQEALEQGALEQIGFV